MAGGEAGAIPCQALGGILKALLMVAVFWSSAGAHFTLQRRTVDVFSLT